MDAVAGKATLPANARRIPIPAAALSQWLADIDDIVELKVTLRVLALLASEPQRRAVPPSIALEDLLDDPVLAEAQLSGVENYARSGLAAAVGRGTLAAIRRRRGDARPAERRGLPEIPANRRRYGTDRRRPVWVPSSRRCVGTAPPTADNRRGAC